MRVIQIVNDTVAGDKKDRKTGRKCSILLDFRRSLVLCLGLGTDTFFPVMQQVLYSSTIEYDTCMYMFISYLT